MSQFYEEEESIYKIIPQEIPSPPKAARYKSKHNYLTPPTSSTFGLAQTSKPGITNIAGETDDPKGSHHVYKKPAASFGPAPGSKKPNPTEFLHKFEKATHVAPCWFNTNMNRLTSYTDLV
jgi:hypothetical protein